MVLMMAAIGAAVALAAGNPVAAWAEDWQRTDSAVTFDSGAAQLPRAPAGFAIETPAEEGAQPVTSPFILSSPKPVPPFPIRLNRSVRRYLSDYLDAPDRLQDSFDRSQPYLPEMVRQLRSFGVPDDMIYLAFAESEFSKTGRGPWQFNSDTARRYGLRIDSYVDERRDPVMSTRAAAEYLATLHDEAGNDWPVALIAWNTGDSNVNRYWSLRGPNFEKFGNRLPRRTKGLLGRFMAVAYIAHHAQSYGIQTVKLDLPPAYRTLRVSGGTPLRRVALDHGTTLKRLRELNPALLRDVVPPDAHAYSIRIPIETRASSSIGY